MRLIAFDLDDTLAPSKSPLPPQMDVALRSLLDHVEVCIISGGQMGQFRTQVLDNLHASDEELSRLHLMPTCGTRYYRFEDGAWVERYAHDLDPEVAARVIESLERHARELGLWEENPWGNIIEDRGSQITFSALGQEAPLDAKRAWDAGWDQESCPARRGAARRAGAGCPWGWLDLGRHHDARHR